MIESSIDDCPTPVFEHSPDTQLSQSSSRQPLIRSNQSDADRHPSQQIGPNTKRGRALQIKATLVPHLQHPKNSNRLFDTPHESPVGAVEPVGIDKPRTTDPPRRTKSVQFSMDPTHSVAFETGKTKANHNSPVDPNTVLSRVGEEAQGTSSGAAVDAMVEEPKSQKALSRQGNVLYKGNGLCLIK